MRAIETAIPHCAMQSSYTNTVISALRRQFLETLNLDAPKAADDSQFVGVNVPCNMQRQS